MFFGSKDHKSRMSILKNVSKPKGGGREIITLKALGGAQVTDLLLQRVTRAKEGWTEAMEVRVRK